MIGTFACPVFNSHTLFQIEILACYNKALILIFDFWATKGAKTCSLGMRWCTFQGVQWKLLILIFPCWCSQGVAQRWSPASHCSCLLLALTHLPSQSKQAATAWKSSHYFAPNHTWTWLSGHCQSKWNLSHCDLLVSIPHFASQFSQKSNLHNLIFIFLRSSSLVVGRSGLKCRLGNFCLSRYIVVEGSLPRH